MYEGMRQVNEERAILVLTDKPGGLVGKLSAERGLVIHGLDEFHNTGVGKDGKVRALESF
jgi:hypothetical protein